MRAQESARAASSSAPITESAVREDQDEDDDGKVGFDIEACGEIELGAQENDRVTQSSMPVIESTVDEEAEAIGDEDNVDSDFDIEAWRSSTYIRALRWSR